MKKQIGRDDKSINVTNSSVINSFNTVSNIDLVNKIRRFFCIRFSKNKYYEDFLNQINVQLQNKLQAHRNNKKYIPEIYLELNDVKEDLRILSQPFLFLSKILEDIKNTDLSFFNAFFTKAGFPHQKINSNLDISSISTFQELGLKTTEILSKFESMIEEAPSFERINMKSKTLYNEDERFLIRHQDVPMRFERLLKYFIESIQLIYKTRLIIFTERAGQGKTNLLCDFADTVLIKKSIPAIFLSGNDFANIQNESIESIILEKVFSFKTKVSFTDFMADIETICVKKRCAFIILIDALNENSNIDIFRDKLYSFTERILNYEFIRLVFTCRTEYFEERFSNFLVPSFKSSQKIVSGFSKRLHSDSRLEPYLSERLIKSYFSYFGVKNFIGHRVKKSLANDFLMLRIFCEVYGLRQNKTAPSDAVHNIYKDDLFCTYYQNKVNEIISRKHYKKTDIQQLFSYFLDYMVTNMTFANIPLSSLDSVNRELLDEIIHEDIIFRKDIVKYDASIFGNNEVLNFTFDEFRDFLIADYIVSNNLDYKPFVSNSKAKALPYIKSTGQYGVQAEGVEKYLFIKSRKALYREELRSIENLPQYDTLFLEHIFDVSDEDIQNNDIDKIKTMFRDKENSERIIFKLFNRVYPEHNTKLNITTLFEFIISLDDTMYDECIGSIFNVKVDYHLEYFESNILLEIIDDLESVLDNKSFVEYPYYHFYFELMLLLSGTINKRSGRTPSELLSLLETYAEKYPMKASEVCLRYIYINNERIYCNIIHLLSCLLNYNYHDFISENFIRQLWVRYENYKERSRYFLERFLKKLYGVRPSLFTEEQINHLNAPFDLASRIMRIYEKGQRN